MTFKVIFGIIVTTLIGYQTVAQNSVLAVDNWLKVGVTESGIYKLDRSFFQDAGLSVDVVDPRNIGVFGYGGGMLPQENATPRPVDLPENAIFFEGEDDGSFDNQDYLLFYAESPDRIGYRQSGKIEYQKNLYSDTAFYFIRIGSTPGKRLISIANEGLGHQPISTFNDLAYSEEDINNLIDTGREWYGQVFTSSSNTKNYQFDLEGVVPNSAIKVVSAVMAQSFGQTTFDVGLNGSPLGAQRIDPIPDALYDVKGVDQVDTFNIQASTLSGLNLGLNVEMKFNRSSTSGTSIGYQNHLILSTVRELKLYGNQTQFRSLQSISQDFSTYTISDAIGTVQVWDITDPQNALAQEFISDQNDVKFGSSSKELKEYVVFSDSEFDAPIFIKSVNNQNLHAISNVDGVIIAPSAFLEAANQLAQFREVNDHLKIAVVTTDQIYNEFSSGRQDITAIRDFIRHVYLKGPQLKYALLFGDGSFDYKGRTIIDTNFVPIYEARNSLHPIFSYSSDDYFGFMEAEEGEWVESTAGDHSLDIGIGRLPVKSRTEAFAIVEKLMNYATDESTLGSWRNEVVFVADDGDFNIHQRDADQLATFVDQNFSAYNPNKIYVDAFPQTQLPNGNQSATGVTTAIDQAISKGTFIVNFTGHGNENIWCEEEILSQENILNWTNKDRLPLFVTATCEFGRYDNPNLLSGGELLVLSENGGAIGLLTTSRPVFSNTNFLLNQAFYTSVFEKIDGEFPRLGDVIRKTKNRSLRGPVNRGFALLGDPMMRLAYPQYGIEITELNNQPLKEGDTIKALAVTKIKGQIINNAGEIQSDFQGRLSATIFDKPTEAITLGNESSPTIFEERKNIIFKGESTISAGNFEVSFVVPKNISYLIKEGKLSFYGRSDGLIDANGANINIKVGGSDPNAIIDSTPPEIELMLNDSRFQTGDKTGANPLVIANLFDDNGINISDVGIGQNISLRLDNENPVNLNSFYVADLDSYQSGSIRYPLNDISEGLHTITLTAFDTHNNPAEKTVEFFVSGDAKNRLTNVINYPNPLTDFTTFSFSHERLSETLDITIDIFNMRGELIRRLDTSVFDTSGTIDNINWDRSDENGNRVRNGLYVYRISMKATDGAVGSAHQKMILID
ncbi:MAG: type IX secretion system sortase PorU [Cyclobacteriaceae bacterium]